MKKTDVRALAEGFGKMIVAGVERAAEDVKRHPERGSAIVLIQSDIHGGAPSRMDILRLRRPPKRRKRRR